MKKLAYAVVAATLATPVLAADLEMGKVEYEKCANCHIIADESGRVFENGGDTGPNLFGIVGKKAGTVEGYEYSKAVIALRDQGYVWTEDDLTTFMKNNKRFLKEKGIHDRSKMSFKMRKYQEDVAAYIASFK